MSDGPSDDDIRRSRAHAKTAKETAAVLSPSTEASKLNPLLLKQVLDRFAPGNDAAEDGIYDQRWLAVDTFYRHTEEYMSPESRPGYRRALDAAFPTKRAAP